MDFLFVVLLLMLSIFYFRHILEDDTLLLFGQSGHSDLRYALTVDEHFRYHLENIPIHTAKLPLLSILYPLQIILGDVLAEKIFTILTLFLAATLVYFANRLFVSKFEGKRGYWLSACCFVGSLVFMYNPWTINQIHHHYWLVLSLAASYLLIAVIDSYLHSSKQRNNINRFILMAFSTSLVATQPQSAIIYFLPMLIIHLVANLIFHRPTILSKYAAKKIAAIVIITTACNLFWLIPNLQFLTAYNMPQEAEFLNYETSRGFVTYGIVQENVDQLSRRATIQNVLEGTGNWLWGRESSQDSSIIISNIDLWQILALLPLIFISLFFIVRTQISKDIIYIVIFFSALVIITVILATGSYYNDIYARFFLDFPLGESVRDPYKFSGLYFVAISFFASASIYRMDKRSLKKNIAIFLLMVGLILSWGWIGLTGDLNGHLTESAPPYPHDLSDVTEYLRTEYGISNNTKGKIFWYPAIDRHQLQYSSVPEISTESLPRLKLLPFQLDYINYLIEKKDTSFIRLLEYLGVQYLVIREDFIDNHHSTEPESLQEMQMRVHNMKSLLSKNIVFESGRFGVYKLNFTSIASVSHAISAGTDDLSIIDRVAEGSEHLSNIELGPFLEDSLIISDRLPPKPSVGTITIVDPTSEHHMPRTYWSAGAINGGWLNTIRPYFDNFGINIWQFDYNKGFIFTWGEKYVPSNYTLENAKTLKTFDFNSPAEILQWQNNYPKNQLFGIQSNAMIVGLNSSNFGWKTITSPAFDVSADGAYVINLRMQYYNAEGVHLKVIEYDKNGIPTKDTIVRNIGSGTSDWKDITFSYKPSSKEVTSIKLSIWHGHLTKQPLPNVLWIDSVRIYDVSDQMLENSISIPFNVGAGSNNNDNNQYKVFVRYLESPQGGLFNTTLEGNSLMQISTLSPYSKLVWKDLGEYTLNPGSHTMTFTNGRGFNAINAILLIQKDQFEVIKGQIQDWLNQDSTAIIHIFEGESDMNMYETTIVDDVPSGNDNNIVLVNGTVWTQFDVKKEGDYRIWVKGSGTFTVMIDDQKEIVNAATNRPTTLSGPFKLKEGESRLEVTPLQEPEKLKIPDYQSNYLADNASNSKANNDTNVIDSIWLVSDSNNNRLYQLLDKDKNDSLNQTQITITTTISDNMWSSQKYEIKLNGNITASNPLMISLAEPFNPDLKAAVYTKDGELFKVENLIPVFYSLKSGIYLDSLPTDAKVMIYDARVPLGWWFVVSSFISLASYVLIVLSANVKLAKGFKGFVYKMNSQFMSR